MKSLPIRGNNIQIVLIGNNVVTIALQYVSNQILRCITSDGIIVCHCWSEVGKLCASNLNICGAMDWNTILASWRPYNARVSRH